MHPRPKYHFTPPENWMNDPNGLIFHKGRYHLYYQHNPFANAFGNISWGHATSKDLLNWEHHKVALHCTDQAMMYSGCVVEDKQGLLCAIYTEHVGDTEHFEERICLAESADGGFTFDQKNRKVILEHTAADFRDPKVFWHDPTASWVMCVALPKDHTILFYRSQDLHHWELCSEFTSRQARGQYWECPDLFALKNEAGEEVWILSISGENVDGESWGMFYFTGSFDGKTFFAEVGARPLDCGSDFYAGITFEGARERIMMGWSGNWANANELKTEGWNGMMASPRRLQYNRGQLYQEIISAMKPTSLKISDTPARKAIQNGMLIWSSEFLEVDRSGSLLAFPGKYQRWSMKNQIDSLDIYEDAGILECVINGGAQVVTLRI